MKLDLSQIFDEEICNLDLDENLNIDTSNEAFETKSDIKLEKPVNIAGGIYLTDDGVYLNAKITYEYIESCARCLTEFSQKIETVLSAKIIEKSNQQTEDDDDDEETIVYYDSRDSELEIEEVITPYILLSLPMKSICDESCKGLCVKCGVNFNLDQCDCDKEDIDFWLVTSLISIIGFT